MNYERNLVLVHTPRMQARSDFDSIKAKMARAAQDIEVFIVSNAARQSVSRREAASRPALIFSPMPLKEFQPLRGKVYAGNPYTKFEEISRLKAAGIRVPESVILTPDTRLDPATWGPFTVLKPNKGIQGKSVRLVRTRDARWVDPQSWPAHDIRHGVDLVAQRFIDTGPYTQHFRVMTVFGQPVYSSTTRWQEPRPAFDANGSEPLDFGISAQASDSRKLTLSYDSDAILYASKAARAFPEIPALGIDLIREEATGDLYVVEVNADGFTWHISSNFGRYVERKHGVNLEGQFGGLNIIADALIKVTRREAV